MANRTGKTTLITGASVGIGRDLAELFAADGHDLILTARNKQQLDELAAKFVAKDGIRVEVIPADLAVPEAGAELFRRVRELGIAVDFLVNNAGFGTHGPFANSDPAKQVGMLQVNVVALTQLTRLFLPEMIGRKSGRIMNVASTAAFQPGPLMAVYYATKAYVVSFSEALDAELAGSGVTVTTLCPGSTATEFHARAEIRIGVGQLGRGQMSSMDVARIGYAAMMAGRRTVIAGLGNRVLAMGSKLSPRRLATYIAGRLNGAR